jgi:8-oxo-dGTP pyrophosphatase MutT (NUDIX family)
MRRVPCLSPSPRAAERRRLNLGQSSIGAFLLISLSLSLVVDCEGSVPAEATLMPRDPIPTWFFAVVVVRKGEHYLLVHETKQGQRWYLPAGRVEAGETLIAAAFRETLEEAGIPVRITGLIRLEHTAYPGGARMRAIYLAEPVSDAPLKGTPDDESLGAAWVRLDELDAFPLRGDDVRELIEYVELGGEIYPLSLVTQEGMPFRNAAVHRYVE